MNWKNQCSLAQLLFGCLPSSLLVLIFRVNNQRQFLLNVTSRWIVTKNGLDNQNRLCECYRSQSSRQIYVGHVVDVCSKLHMDFDDFCLFSVSDQLVVGIVFSCFWLINYKNIILRYSMTIQHYFCVDESIN